MKPRLAIVHWLDAVGNREGKMPSDEPLRGVHCVSIGVLIERTRGKRGYIKIAGELIEDGTYEEVVAIPNGAVLKVTFVPVALPAELGQWTLKK